MPAETLLQAQDAAGAVEIDYEALPAVTDARAALQKGAPQLFDGIPGNLVFDWDNDTSDFAATGAAFARAAHVKTLEIVNTTSDNRVSVWAFATQTLAPFL
jgi:aerobic carbon-monoxide dehydrogenase large subunit